MAAYLSRSACWLAALLAVPAAAALRPGPSPAAVRAPATATVAQRAHGLLARRCFACHGPGKQQGGLRLGSRREALEGGDGGPVLVPGRPEASRLIALVAAGAGEQAMPPSGPRLSPAEVELLREWIRRGAEWPAGTGAGARPEHWSFRPIQRPSPPLTRRRGWGHNPVDRFILARLEQAGLRPSPPADRVTLIRRVTLDLTGLPPTPQEVDAFLADRAPGAYERVVDRLLASPRYGERWARHWLDLARYADSNGYTIDSARQMWMYRDWVIRAFNRDLPFDQFTIEQLAGVLLPTPTREQLIATGFHRNTLTNEEGGTDQEQFRVEAVMDRVNTTGLVWMGLTAGCAQCHSHKYDPLTQREYYQLYAFFNQDDEPVLSDPSPEQARQREELGRRLEAARGRLAEVGEGAPGSVRQPLQQEVAALERELRALEAAIPSALVLRARPEPRPNHVLLRGDFLRPGAPVRAGTPSVLPPLPPADPGREPGRLDLARWLVASSHPLTPRVTVNRFWDQLFPRGLVETENDFGTQGARPSHPELLDWLASAFAAPRREGDPHALGWSIKGLLRLLVTSATYRQSSVLHGAAAQRDPENRLLARQSRLRLPAEAIRDAALAAAGLLSPRIGGPSVFPPQPGGTDAFTQVKKNWTVSTGEDRYRRGLYTFHWRSSPYPLFAALDAPGGSVTCTRRARSNTPLQSLMLANDETFVEAAAALATRVQEEAPGDPRGQIEGAFRRCLARRPSPPELNRLLDYYRSQLPEPDTGPAGERTALAAVARALMNLDEFITRE